VGGIRSLSRLRAVAAYRRAVQRGSHSAAYHLGVVLAYRGDVAGARVAFHRPAAHPANHDLTTRADSALAQLRSA
jgi:hypothetical protein